MKLMVLSFFFFFQNEHELGRIITKRVYKETYTHIGESSSDQVQEDETPYIALRTISLLDWNIKKSTC